MNFVCNQCGKLIKSDTLPSSWISFTESEVHGLRLYEKIDKYHYESFHVPNKEEKFYCSKKCALVKINKSIELFLAEISPIRARSSTQVIL